MARPRTVIGTYGKIKVTQLREKSPGQPAVFEARARFRMANGAMRRPRARGASATAARNALKKKMAALEKEATGGVIDASTRIAHVAELWLAEFRRKVDQGKRSPKSLYDYEALVRTRVKPRLGELACREASVTAFDNAIKAVYDADGAGTAKKMKTVCSGIAGYAVRHGAMTVNPVREVEPVEVPSRGEIVVLEPAERGDFRAKLAAYCAAKGDSKLGVRARAWTDLPDIGDGMLSTGGRIGEVLAVIGDDIDPTNQTVVLDHHLVWVRGQGMVRMPLRKGRKDGLVIVVPSWSVPMWRRRKLESGGGPVFPSWNGQWQFITNVTKRFRTVCDDIGYPHIASHVFRHTVGTHLDEQGTPLTAIADQLGNTPAVVERHYRRKRKANEATAGALESLFDQGEGTG
ncbi:tyrosine-type recombinase/integrase [Amycolatopsis suaedae]|uniref:Tyr recombinase domain-containing protein n=1 Tax=Amycolatopsis suaedae TaxID=2510978 RepID=A0A4Q7IZV5_9PSEU|nr:site-specific integrase [Amycolatopsis suaedae]RZQ59802.1 hypothetical protein EWH70_32315 [Amycolatopsis suaedae]